MEVSFLYKSRNSCLYKGNRGSTNNHRAFANCIRTKLQKEQNKKKTKTEKKRNIFEHILIRLELNYKK